MHRAVNEVSDARVCAVRMYFSGDDYLAHSRAGRRLGLKGLINLLEQRRSEKCFGHQGGSLLWKSGFDLPGECRRGIALGIALQQPVLF
jgi:hypothetical protein